MATATRTRPSKESRRKESHVGIRNEALFCFHCGQFFKIPFPIEVTEMIEKNKSFEKLHKTCKKIWKPPVVDQSCSENFKAVWWNEGMNGERGTSSLTMFAVMIDPQLRILGIKKEEFGHPHDPDDFRRCYLLLKTVPEWKEKLHLMKAVSPVWEKLVDNWSLFTEMLEELMRGKTNNLYDLMKEIGC